jgi:hypothetical protein
LFADEDAARGKIGADDADGIVSANDDLSPLC